MSILKELTQKAGKKLDLKQTEQKESFKYEVIVDGELITMFEHKVARLAEKSAVAKAIELLGYK